MNKDIQVYNNALFANDKEICDFLITSLASIYPWQKIKHGTHILFGLNGNPVVGYSKLKDCIRLLFWSGQSFNEEALMNEGKFKAAEMRYTSTDQINKNNLIRWLKKSEQIQWDYKNIVKRKGVLERLV